MKNGYRIIWTDNALSELKATLAYLEGNFSEKELQSLAKKIEHILKLISENPLLFSKSDLKGTHRVVILKFNTMYYKVSGEEVQIVSFFSNRRDLGKRKL